jgi:membrane associated rhomboid family serine protease
MRRFLPQFIGVTVMMAFFIPNINHWGHAGGFVGGFIAAAIVGVKGVKPFIARTALTVITFVILASGLWIGGVNLVENHDFDGTNRWLILANWETGNYERALELYEIFFGE